MIFLLFLIAAVLSIILALIEAFLISWLMPLTGIPYDPSYWQAFTLAILVNIMVSFAGVKFDTK